MFLNIPFWPPPPAALETNISISMDLYSIASEKIPPGWGDIKCEYKKCCLILTAKKGIVSKGKFASRGKN